MRSAKALLICYLFHASPHLLRIGGVVQRGFFGDAALAVESEDGLIHGDHTLPRSGGNGVVDLVALVVPDEAADGAVHVHDLESGDQVPVHIGQQLLGDHGAQHIGQLEADLGLLGAGEGVHNAVDGIHRAHGVQGGDEGVAGFGKFLKT